MGNASDGIDLSELQFAFSVRQADIEFPQTAQIRVYNIAPATTAKIKTNEYTRIILQAGYQDGAFGVIFDGQVVQARLGRESAVDTYMDVLCSAGYSNHQAVINQTLAAGATVTDTANAAAAAMACPLNADGITSDFKLPRGQALYGMARDKLHQAAATAGSSFFYENGAVTMVPLQGFKPGAAVILNSATGMIGWPEQTQDGIKVRCLLNPLIAIGSRLQIDNASILRAPISNSYQFVNNLPGLDSDGLYRVYVIDHRGNTRGQDWYSDIIGLSIDPANSGRTSLVQKGQF